MNTIWKSKTPAPVLGFVLLGTYLAHLSFREPMPYTIPGMVVLVAYGIVMASLMFAWIRHPQLLMIKDERMVVWSNGWPRTIPAEHIVGVRIHRFSKPTRFRRAIGAVFFDYRGGGIAHAHLRDAADLLEATNVLTRQFPERCQFFLDHRESEDKSQLEQVK